MARYTGPVTKKSRAVGQSLTGYDKAFEKKKYPPGQHGPSRKRKQKSDYAIQLMEKQKAKYTYGILEKQFENLFERASRMKGITGENLLALCESRLDNTVYRLGLSTTRRGARQLVTHRHITVNGEVVNVPSYSLRVGDVIAVREKSKSLESISNSLGSGSKKFDWLDWNGGTMSGKFISMPARDMIPENIKEQLIVELYSK